MKKYLIVCLSLALMACQSTSPKQTACVNCEPKKLDVQQCEPFLLDMSDLGWRAVFCHKNVQRDDIVFLRQAQSQCTHIINTQAYIQKKEQRLRDFQNQALNDPLNLMAQQKFLETGQLVNHNEKTMQASPLCQDFDARIREMEMKYLR